MAVLWITLILSCICGGVMACMSSQLCVRYQNEAMTELMSGNTTEYCRLQSKAIACYSGDVFDCSDPAHELDTTYSAYYDACSLTAADVTNCSALITASCSEERLNTLSNENLEEFCSDTDTYQTCLLHNMSLCHSSVAVYDVLGVEFANYERMCSEPWATEQCQTLTFSNCSSLLLSLSEQANQEDTCRSLETYLECMNTSMQYCDPSVDPADVYGPFQTGYNIQCRPNSTCPAVSTCLQEVQTTSGQGPGADNSIPNFFQECSNMGTMFTCMDLELRKCNVTSPQPYTFMNLTYLYNSACQDLQNTTEVLTCPEMNACMSNLSVPISDDPADLMELYYDPEFWCLYMRHGMDCASNLTDVCGGNKTIVTAILNRTNKMCFGADPPTTVTPGSTTGEGRAQGDISSTTSTEGTSTSNISTTSSTQDTSGGPKTNTSILVFLSTLLIILLKTV